ncbi:PAS domain-containing protein [Minwuia sp.]|uniref:PAS domain-containing protein n=1 Tax=Minwuia sp. TaxID=2493630 RepID=UPI003A959668
MLANSGEAAVERAVLIAAGRLSSGITHALLENWTRARGSGLWPRRRSLRPDQLLPLLPNLAILQIERAPLDFRYRLTGTLLDRQFGQCFTGVRASEIGFQTVGTAFWVLLSDTAQDALPQASTVSYIGTRGETRVAEMVSLPYSTDGMRVDQILIGLDFVPVAEV